MPARYSCETRLMIEAAGSRCRWRARGPDGVHSSPSRCPASGEIVSKAHPEDDIPCWARTPTDVKASTGRPSLSRHESTTRQTNSARSCPRSPSEPNTSQSGNPRRPARRTATLQPLLTVTEVAAVLNVSARTIRRLAASGSLQTVRIGRAVRFRVDEVERMITMGEGL
jgi:excisionase family DNA binding protein